MFGDLAHTFQQPGRSLHDLQVLATAGNFGKSVGNPMPFDNLRVAQLREQLHAQGNHDTDKEKGDLQHKLLCGVQRVPTMLVLDPTQPLSHFHLEDYSAG